MRKARVEYPSGREVLKDYWGFLTSGGLIVGDRSFIPAVSIAGSAAALAESLAAGGDAEPAASAESAADGEQVVLDVRIASLRKEYQIAGRVRLRSGGRAVIAFDAGPSQDALLNAAWADGEDVPERRHRRWRVTEPMRYRAGEREGMGRLIDISRGGCCVAAAAALRVGMRMFVEIAGAWVEARVRWANGRSGMAGLEFSRFQEELVAQLIEAHTREEAALL